MYNKFNKIHFIGIGGIGMSGIAELLHRHHYVVSGSDLQKGETARRLERLGVEVHVGHAAENLKGAELVVYSSAVRRDNPEMVAAVERKIPVITRAEMLAELMRLKYGIAVAGAHGKTTTTSMISMLLTEGGLDPTIVVGGRVDHFGGANARLGSGDFMVVEADESDGSFNRLSPSIAVVTNMDREHMDHYKTMAKLKSAFLSFMNKVPFYGITVLCGDDPYLRVLAPRLERRKKSYGFLPENDYRLSEYAVNGLGSHFVLESNGEKQRVTLQVPGKHNALNAVAAIAVADELSISRQVAVDTLQAFQGVQRRFQKRGSINGVLFIDDYAHHPTEIRATIRAAREQFPNSKIRVVFQPHRYSRVEDLFDRFATCFKDSNAVAVTDVYAAGENPIPGIDGRTLHDLIAATGNGETRHVSSALVGVETWLAESKEGDIILTLGAGDLPNVYKQLF